MPLTLPFLWTLYIAGDERSDTTRVIVMSASGLSRQSPIIHTPSKYNKINKMRISHKQPEE